MDNRYRETLKTIILNPDSQSMGQIRPYNAHFSFVEHFGTFSEKRVPKPTFFRETFFEKVDLP